MARNELFEKLLGKKQAAAATDAVEQLDKALEEAGVEHKALEDVDTSAVADALVDVMKSELSDEDKRAAVVDLISDLMPGDRLAETEKAAKKDDMTDEPAPDDEEDDEDEDDDETGKGLAIVAKMVDDLGAVAEAQLDIETQFNALKGRMDTRDDDLKAFGDRLAQMETLVAKAIAGRPKLASKAAETVVEDEEKLINGMREMMTEYEIDPQFGIKVKKTGV